MWRRSILRVPPRTCGAFATGRVGSTSLWRRKRPWRKAKAWSREGMVEVGTKRGRWRPIAAVIVLYAFVLQAILGGLVPLRMLDHAGYLCSEAVEPGRNGDGPIKVPAHHDTACCTAAHAAPDTGTPLAAASFAIVWPAREAGAAIRPVEPGVSARAPPGSRFLARGPPTA